MSFTAITDFNPPTIVGSSRMLYSPDLFDAATGAYPKSPLPSTIAYPADINGRIAFFQGIRANKVWPFYDNGSASLVYDEQNLNPPDGHEADEPPVGYATYTSFGDSLFYFLTAPDPPYSQLVATEFSFSENIQLSNLTVNAVFASNGSISANYQSNEDGYITGDIFAAVEYDIGNINFWRTCIPLGAVNDYKYRGVDPEYDPPVLSVNIPKTYSAASIIESQIFSLDQLRLRVSIKSGVLGNIASQNGLVGNVSGDMTTIVYALYVTF